MRHREGGVGVQVGLLPTSADLGRESPNLDSPLSLRRLKRWSPKWTPTPIRHGGGFSHPLLCALVSRPGGAHAVLCPWCPSGLPLPEPSIIFRRTFWTFRNLPKHYIYSDTFHKCPKLFRTLSFILRTPPQYYETLRTTFGTSFLHTFTHMTQPKNAIVP